MNDVEENNDERLEQEIAGVVKTLRSTFNSGKTLSIDWRKQQLNQLAKLLKENKDDFVLALKKDLRQTDLIADAEVEGPIKEIDLALQHINEWMKPEKKAVPLLHKPGSGLIVKEPLGVVLIIAPWNYPFSLWLKPMIGAIAAGNCVVIKPSEVARHCSHVAARLIPRYMDKDSFRVVEGAVKESTILLKQEWDYIFYTGNGTVGKIVMRAAAEYLTPVTLELGGKSPTIVDSTVNLDVAVKRICWAKFTVNAGQTCVAPDYVLVSKDIKDAFLDKMKTVLKDFYGDDVKNSKDYSRIINEQHTRRIKKLIEGQKVFLGGEVDEQHHYIAPTILTDVDPSTPVMQEEIFGPVLPVLEVSDVDEAISFINSRPKPLALYIFSNDKTNQTRVISRTSSGGVAVNDAVLHVICPELPFGGVGPSGMGAYNGKATFDTFSHRKSVLDRATWSDPSLRYPPYTESKLKWLKLLNGGLKLPVPKWLLFTLLMAPVVAFLWYRYQLRGARL